MLALLAAAVLATSTAHAAPRPPPATPAAPASPAPPAEPAAAAAPGSLVGDWPQKSSGRRVTLDQETSIDDAVVRICEAAGWDLVLDTGADGEEDVNTALRDTPVEDALVAVLVGSPLAAHREGNVVTVARPGQPRLSGLASGGSRITLSGDYSLDDALQRVGRSAGWSVVLHTGAPGDATVRLRMRSVPAELAVRALLWGTPINATRTGNVLSLTEAGSAEDTAPREILSGFDKPTGKTFTGDFDDAPAEQALRKVLDAAGLSMVLPKGIHGTVTGHFHDAPVEDVLRAVCAEAGLSATRQGSVVIVRRLGPAFHFQFNSDDSDEARRDAEEARRDAEEAQREAEDEARQAADEARQEADEARQEAEESASPGNGNGHDRVSTGSVTIGPGEHVRDLVALRGNATLGPGAHAREVTAVMGSVEIGPGAIVDREVTAVGGNVHVASGARVGKSATSVGGKVFVDPGALVHGEQVGVSLPGIPALPGIPPPERHVRHNSGWIGLGYLLLTFAVSFALGLVLQMVFPRRLERVVQALNATPARSLAIGLLGMFTLPLLGILLTVTLVGIVLVFAEALLVAVGTVLGFAALAVLIGRKIPLPRGHKATPVGQLAIGTAAITLVARLPNVGGVLMAIGWVVVFGAVLATRFGQQDAGDGSSFPLRDVVDAP